MLLEKLTLNQRAFADLYMIENSPEIDPDRLHPCMVVCPGGGYAFTSDREAEPVARKFLAADYSAVVLTYTTAPLTYPAPLVELARTVAYLRENAQRFNIDPDRIFVSGFSAGGHLAASLSVFWDKPWLWEASGKTAEQIKPNGAVLGYPVITYQHLGTFQNLLGENAPKELIDQNCLETQVSKNTPPTYLWHTANDPGVSVGNSLLYALSLAKYNIPFSMHVFKHGTHGLSCCDKSTSPVNHEADYVLPDCAVWVDDAIGFLNTL